MVCVLKIISIVGMRAGKSAVVEVGGIEMSEVMLVLGNKSGSILVHSVSRAKWDVSWEEEYRS